MQNGANGTSICTTTMATSSHLRGQSPKAARFIRTEVHFPHPSPPIRDLTTAN